MSLYIDDRLVRRFGYLVIYKDYTEMHGQQNIKFCNAKEAKLTHQYKYN